LSKRVRSEEPVIARIEVWWSKRVEGCTIQASRHTEHMD
jgi:hypothetical protein